MATSPEAMFDPEVVAELRRQFQEADKDGSGEIDAFEACKLFARSCAANASEAEIQKTAEGLRHQMDSDRSGTISFNEYCFRFGRRYQMELNRRRRTGASASSASPADAAQDSAEQKLKKERDELDRERAALRQERERLQLEKERETLRREREALERERQQAASAGAAGSGASTQDSQELIPDSRVRVQGLHSAPAFNGREAKVLRFDEAAGRYVVELDGSGGQKISLRRENLVKVGSAGGGMSQQFSDLAQKAKSAVQNGCANAQVWLASSGYEWWQVLLGVAVVVLIISAWIQASSRHSGPRTAPGTSGRRAPQFEDAGYRDDYHDRRTYSGGGYEDDNYGYDSHHGGYGGGGGGFDFGGMQKYLIIGGLAFLCWKGIIPVHRMDWFQLYMLWNMLQSSGILGGGGGGYGRRRRGFF